MADETEDLPNAAAAQAGADAGEDTNSWPEGEGDGGAHQIA